MVEVASSRGVLLQYVNHMSIGMSPFYAFYGYHPLSFIDVMFDDSKAPRAKIWIQESQDILRALKDNMATTQNQQKLYVDRVGWRDR